MRCNNFLASLALCGVLATPCVSQSLNPKAAAEAFHEARQLSASAHGDIWDLPLYGAMIFVDPTAGDAISNEPDALNTFKKVGEVYQGRLPETIQIANTAIEWEGKRWTMIQWPLPQGTLVRQRLLAHEMFHRIQPSLGIPIEDATNEQLDTMEGRVWTFLEWRALAAALTSASNESKSQAISDALHFRQHRRELFPNSATNERKLELSEGLAEYTGVVISEPDGRSAHWHAISRLADPSSSQSLVRSFAYTSGPAYGLLLDMQRPGWRRRLTERSDLSELLQGSSRLISINLDQRATVYGAASIREQETERKQKSDAVKAMYRADLVTGPTLTLPILDKLDFSFDPGELTPLDEGMVYPSLHATDEWGSIEVTQGALVSFPKHFLRVAGPAKGTDGTITGPGWVLKLAPGWMISLRGDKSFEAHRQ